MRHFSREFLASSLGPPHDLRDYERILASNIKDVIGEIHFADVNILIAYATNQKHGNMNDLVASSTELFFKDQTLTYARKADVTWSWIDVPSVVLQMEFSHGPVFVSFKLLLGQSHAGLLIDEVLLDAGMPAELFDSADFDRLLNSARLKPGAMATAPSSATRH